MEDCYGKRVDSATTCAAGQADQKVASVGEIDRTKNRNR